jgi:hypothetical protein
MSAHKQLLAAIRNYLRENRRFGIKHFKSSAIRARHALSELMDHAKDRRKEILDIKKSLPTKHKVNKNT